MAEDEKLGYQYLKDKINEIWEKISELEKNIQRNWNLIQGNVQDILPDELSKRDERIEKLEKKVDAWIDDIRIGNKERFKLKDEVKEIKSQNIGDNLDNMDASIIKTNKEISELEKRSINLLTQIPRITTLEKKFNELMEYDRTDYAERIEKLEKKVGDIRNRILNIKPNNELFIKCLRMQQQIDGLYQSIHGIAPSEADNIKEVLRELFKKVDDLYAEWTGLENDNDQLEQRIDDLEDKLSKCGVVWDYRLDEQYAEIRENLIPRMEIEFNSHKALRQEISELKEVLRKSIKEIGNYLDTNRFEYLLSQLGGDSKSSKKMHTQRVHLQNEINEELVEAHRKLNIKDGEKSVSGEVHLKDLPNGVGKDSHIADSRPAKYVSAEEDYYDPQREECEHNRPFWECEICGNTRSPKEPTPSKCGDCEIGIADPTLDECKPCFEKEPPDDLAGSARQTEDYECRNCFQIFSIIQDIKTEETQITWCPFCKSYSIKYLKEDKKDE